MKVKYILRTLILLSISSCYTSEYSVSDESKHFEIDFTIEQNENMEGILTFDIKLDSGYYFVSPHSQGIHQRLIFSIENTDNILLNGNLIEHPTSLEEFDQLSEKKGKFVRENTVYKQKLTIKSGNDFDVSGLIWLEIRPNCQPYEISFIISNKSGKLKVENSKLIASGYPTFWDMKRIDTLQNN